MDYLSGQKLLTAIEFSTYLCSKIQNYWPQSQLDLLTDTHPIQISIELPQTGKISCSVEHIYADFLKRPEQLDAVCQLFITALQDVFASNRLDDIILLPTIERQQWLDSMDQPCDVNNFTSPIARISLVSDLFIVFTLYKNETFTFASEAILAELTDTPIPIQANLKAMEISTTHLRPLLEEIQITHTQIGYRVSLPTVFDVSLIILFEEWEHLLQIKGTPVFALIARDYFIVADSADLLQIDLLRKTVDQEIKTQPYALSAELFTFRNNLLTVY